MSKFDGLSDVDMLARIMDAEAGQEGIPGKVAVGAVIQNRARTGGYGDGIRGVITKPGQFSAINDVTGYAGGKGANDLFWREPSEESRQVAQAILAGNYEDITGGATHYFNPRHANPKWARGKKFKPIGNHVFGNADAGRVSGGGGADTLQGGDNPEGGYFSQWRNKQQNRQVEATSTAPAQGGYFSKWRARQEAKNGPGVKTDAPAMPAGMNQQAEPGMFRRAADAVVGAVAGDAEFDVPEIESNLGAMENASGGDVAGLSRDLFLADGEEAMANIIQKHSPETPIEADGNGNLYAIVNGERYALDKSGLSGRDATEVVKGLAAALVTITGAKVGGALVGGAGRVVGAGAGAGGEQAAEQIVSNAVGGDQPFDMGRVILGSVFGLGGEALTKAAEVVGPKLIAAIGAAKQGSTNRQEFEAALTAQGLDLREVNDILNSALPRSEQAELGADALARIADAQALDVPIDLTTGQATRSPVLYREEHSAGAMGGLELAQQAEGVRTLQQRALAANAENMVGGLGAGSDRAQRGAAVQAKVKERRDAAWSGVGEAYKRARNAKNQPVIPEGPLVSFISDTGKRIRQVHTPGPDDTTQRMIADFRETISEKGTSLVELERWRSRATQAKQSAKGSDRRALGELIKAYDGAIQGGLMAQATGDRSAVGLWRRAVKSRSEYGKKYENDSIVDRLSRQNKDRPGELNLDAQDVMSELLSASGFGKKGAAREALRLRKFLGKDSPEWAEVQAEGLVRLLGFEPTQFAGGNISTKVISNLRKAMKEQPQLMKVLFTESQRSQIQRFARVVENTSVAPRDAGTPNASGSGLMTIEAAGRQFERVRRAAEAFGRAFGTGGDLITRIVLKSVTGAENAAKSDAARRSLQGLPLQRTPSPALPGVGGAAGGSIGEEFSRQ